MILVNGEIMWGGLSGEFVSKTMLRKKYYHLIISDSPPCILTPARWRARIVLLRRNGQECSAVLRDPTHVFPLVTLSTAQGV
jgi:hypothetical protein